MKADPQFASVGPEFWANVRTISETLGYVKRANHTRCREIKMHTVSDMATAMRKCGLGTAHLVDPETDHPTALAEKLRDYFVFRANLLLKQIGPSLMSRDRAERVFNELRTQFSSTGLVPLNEQFGANTRPLFLTGIVNMLIESGLEGRPCNYDPAAITSFTSVGKPLKTLSRRHDGAFPGNVNPIAVWEIKEYYDATSFGSKIADEVYMTRLDGLEIGEARNADVGVQFVLMVDAYPTLWESGLSYLVRLVDLLHMGYVDEVLFGSEVLTRLPIMVREWAAAYDS